MNYWDFYTSLSNNVPSGKLPVFVGVDRCGGVKFMTIATTKNRFLLIDCDRDGNPIDPVMSFTKELLSNDLTNQQIIEYLNNHTQYMWDILPDFGEWKFGFFSHEAYRFCGGSLYRSSNKNVVVTCVGDNPKFFLGFDRQYQWDDTIYVGVVTQWMCRM